MLASPAPSPVVWDCIGQHPEKGWLTTTAEAQTWFAARADAARKLEIAPEAVQVKRR